MADLKRIAERLIAAYDRRDHAAADHGGRAGFFRRGRLRGAARDRDAPARAGLAAGGPQDRLHQPHDLAALRRVSADVGACLDATRCISRRTARRRCRCRGFVQPRIEPEVVFKIKAPVPLTDDPEAVLACVEWMAPGFEIVQSHFPDWKFAAADCTAAFGLHGALVVGAPVAVTDANRGRIGRGIAGIRGDAVARRRGDRPRRRLECAGQPGAGARSSRPPAGRAAAGPEARRRRDRHHRHDHRCLAGRRRRDLVLRLWRAGA